MKVDMSKLVDDYRCPNPYHQLAKKAVCFAMCLALLGAGSVYQSMSHTDSALADELYDEYVMNPSFTVQHVGDMTTVNVQPGEGTVTVLTDGTEDHHAELKEDGTFEMVTERRELYEEYETSWTETNSIAAASFLNGEDGSATKGYVIKEVWFGQNKNSENPSDFLILKIPDADGKPDLSKVMLTNNPNHPGLSEAADGYYAGDENDSYVIYVHDGDVMRLIFETKSRWNVEDVNVFDYDVSDGYYYRGEDYFHKGGWYHTLRQANERGTIYVNAMENGIHSAENYEGNGPKFAFGGNGIGTSMADEFLDSELDTINTWNRGQQEETSGMGVTKGLVTGVSRDGNLKWTDRISYLDLFGINNRKGKTNYTNKEYSFLFGYDGFSRTLSSVCSEYDTEACGLESLTDVNGKLTNSFWILDTAPSYGTDGHDPVWGSGSEKTQYYRSGDRMPGVFEASDDGLDHNSFFGFAYAEDFILSPGYVGPLAFFGYSDDDLWVFAGQVDDDGQVIPDTVVQVADLGGVHDGAAYYCDMWNMIDKVKYGEEAQEWRLFVFWLEREGTSASCYLNFTLPDAAIVDERDTGSVMIEASEYSSVKGDGRTFVLDDGTHDRYRGIYGDGTEVTIVSGEEFMIPSGSFLNIEGLTAGDVFMVRETGRAKVWFSTGDIYEEGNTVTGIVGADARMSFISAMNVGTLSITVEADGTSDGGYEIILGLDSKGSIEVSAMDGHNNPLGSRFTDNEGQLVLTLGAGETVMLYNLPDSIGFTLEPQTVAGWRVSEILVDENTSFESVVTGKFPASVTYRYKEKEKLAPQIIMEQSVSGDWSMSEILLGTGTLLSYKITVTNPNDVPVDVRVEDRPPEELEVMTSSLLGGGVQNGQILNWNLTLDPYSVAELSFTCQVTTEETAVLENNARVIVNDETVTSSNSVKVTIP